jgi:uncharacterized protein DUF5985
MAAAVYLLCFVTSTGCTLALSRSYRQSRVRLLFWSSLCFAGLALNNLLLFVDLVLVPGADLELLRTAVAFVAIMILLYGLMAEA